MSKKIGTTNPTIERLFDDKPEALELFKIVNKYICSLGPDVRQEVTKTQVSFGTFRKFAWVWLPQMWVKKRPSTSLTVSFVLHEHILDPRIAEASEPKPGQWMHHVVINSKADLDDTLKTWLAKAYALNRK